MALAAWLDQRGVKAAAFERVWERLATAPLKLKLGDRMVKLDPSTGEWFLVQLSLALIRRLVDGAARNGELPLIDAPGLSRLIPGFPPGTLPLYRRRREYLSSRRDGPLAVDGAAAEPERLARVRARSVELRRFAPGLLELEILDAPPRGP